MVEKLKEFYKSRTFWVNVLAIVGGIATALSGELVSGGAVTVFGILNIILRAITKQGIKFN